MNPNQMVPAIAGTLEAGANSTGGDRQPGMSQQTAATMLIPEDQHALHGDPSHPVTAHGHAPAIAIQAGATRENPESGPDGVGVRQDGASYTIEARQEVQAVAFDMRGREGGAQFEGPHDTANIRAASGGSSKSYVATWAVRRLTPTECERLQGFPDGYTQIPRGNKPTADGPRYKALGNSMAVNVMRVIGQRLALIEGW